MYDALALAGSRGRKTVPIQRHLGRKGTSALAPSLDTSGLAGSIRFFDARVADARLVRGPGGPAGARAGSLVVAPEVVATVGVAGLTARGGGGLDDGQ